MRMLAIAAALAALALGSAAQAKEYMFSLSWEPAFCRTENGAKKTECKELDQRDYAAANFVLHGLWPQKVQYCGVPKDVIALDQNNQTWKDMPPVAVSAETRKRMDTYFPGVASYLDRHEWYKHGTCSGMTPDTYFNTAMDLVAQSAALEFGKFISANVGKTIKIDDLCAKLTHDFGSTFLKATVVKQPNGELGELRFQLKDTGKPLALDAEHLSTVGNKTLNCAGTLSIDAAAQPGS